MDLRFKGALTVEFLILGSPQPIFRLAKENTSTPILMAEDQVAYGTGGWWGEWSGGGGSSPELKDPQANHRLATSSTGGTAFGVRLLNGTATVLTRMSLQFTGEVWRQSSLAKALQFYYFVDPSGTSPFPTNPTAFIPALNVSFPPVAADAGGVAADGTASVNQTNLGVLNQTITNWPPGAALWLVWQMPDATGKAQGLAIDNLSFSAGLPPPVPLAIQAAGTNLLVSWPGGAGQAYQLEYKDDLAAPAWTPLGGPLTGAGATLSATNAAGPAAQRFFRLRLLN
jgi:hypothetical protein